MKIFSVFSILVLLLFSGCKKEINNQLPYVEFSYMTTGLLLELAGSVFDLDGQVERVEIQWGDGHYYMTTTGFTDLRVSHQYDEPGTYTVLIIAEDDQKGEITMKFVVPIDYDETSMDGIKPGIYKASGDEFLILTLNLHTYQEDRQNEKFVKIIDLIGMLDIDFVLFQECAQHKTASIVEGNIRSDNMALIIRDALLEKYGVDYNFTWDWAHYGWSVWEEGLAVLSKHTLAESDSRYISTSTSASNISSRKVVYGAYEIPDKGRFHLFSVHTHWRTSETDAEQNTQIQNIKSMVLEKEQAITGENVISIVAGDFNVTPTADVPWSEGYFIMTQGGVYTDTFLEIYPLANSIPAQSIYNTIGGVYPGRIDYIFQKENPSVGIEDSQIIFTPQIVGQVSDHFGVITKIKVTP